MGRKNRITVSLLTALLLLVAAPVRADEEVDPTVQRAREQFVEGARLAKQTLWGEALSRFEASAKLVPHAGTSFNIGVCQRALGRYLAARGSLQRALSQHESAPEGQLPADTLETITAYLEEIESVLGVLDVTLEPKSATVAVDGRPLEVVQRGKHTTLVAGTLAPGPGKRPPGARFSVELDPGSHVFVIAREGFADAVVRRDVKPGERGTLELVLEKLPGTLAIKADQTRATVRVDGVDVGLAPVSLLRPGGRYHVVVDKEGYEPYEGDVRLRAAQRFELMAKLAPEKPGIHERWWFWTSLAGAVASVAVTTWYVTRPEPQRPGLDGGGLGWAIEVP